MDPFLHFGPLLLAGIVVGVLFFGGMSRKRQRRVMPELDLSTAGPKTQTKSTAGALHLMTLHLVAGDGASFSGYDLLQSLLDVGMRFGKMNIFHRFAEDDKEHVLFSMASMTSPGTFDIDQMGGTDCRGLSFFFQIDKVSDPLAVFEDMYRTACELQDMLGGQVMDSQHQVMNTATAERYRAQLREHLASQPAPTLKLEEDFLGV